MGLPTYTWKEVAAKNTEKECWVSYGKKVYDITDWLDKHPGGKKYLLLVAGRDVTDLLPSYHPFTDKPEQVLEKYHIGFVSDFEFPQYKPDTGFYKTLRTRVGNYFKTNNLNYKDPVPGLIRLAGFFTVAIITFLITNSSKFHWTVRLLAAQIFGACQALPLLHSMHDASHTSIGNSATWWDVIGRLTMDWYAGASLVSWHNQHILGHHVYTNVLEIDPDLPVKKKGDIRRVVPRQTWLSFYRFQHIYLLFLYGVLAIKFRIQDILGTLIDHSNGAIRVNLPKHEYLNQFLSKSFFAFWRIVVPLYFWKVPQLEFWTYFIVSEFATGYYLTFNFQVSHVSPSADFPDKELGAFSDEWAIAQVKTTVDYAHGNSLMTLLCGALNYQVVHHLFPSVSQYHYPAIAPIVLETCKEYNVPYVVLPSFTSAFQKHVEHLKDMGKKNAA